MGFIMHELNGMEQPGSLTAVNYACNVKQEIQNLSAWTVF